MKKKNDWRWLSPGAYVDEAGTLHFVIPEMLQELGVPDTPQTREELIQHARQFIREEPPKAEITAG